MSHQSSSYTPFSPPNDPSDPPLLPPKDRPHQQFPVSPPTTSASPSHIDASGSSSPHPSVFTPTSAPLMSADPSQQGFSPTSEPPQTVAPPVPDDNSSHLRPDHDRDTLRHERTAEHRTSSKHRLPDDETELDGESHKRRRTDHDRQPHVPDPTNPSAIFGSLYKVADKPVSISRPHPALNLLSLYGLDQLSSSVARKDPVTGEKINKLRKSYEGKIKDLPGRNKAVANGLELFTLINYPPDEWEIHQVKGKEISSALSQDGQNLSDDFMSKLGSALNMTPAPLPPRENEHWRNIIDLESATTSKPGNGPSQGAAKPETQRTNSNAASPSAEPLRPRRRGTKRNYHDESFEGYEDYGDELGDNMSIDDDDRRSTASSTAKKKRRKETGSASHFSGSMSQFSPSTVSVGGNGSR